MLNKEKATEVKGEDPVIAFQSSLEDVIIVLNKLGPMCQDMTELAKMCESGVYSTATARLLLKLVTEKK